jgi:hypothetical protein
MNQLDAAAAGTIMDVLSTSKPATSSGIRHRPHSLSETSLLPTHPSATPGVGGECRDAWTCCASRCLRRSHAYVCLHDCLFAFLVVS